MIYIYIYIWGGHITPEFSVGYGVKWAFWLLDCSPIRWLNIMWKWQNRPLLCTNTQTHTDKIQYRILFPKSNQDFLAFQFLILIFNRCLEELYYWVYCIYFTCIRNRCHCKKNCIVLHRKCAFILFFFCEADLSLLMHFQFWRKKDVESCLFFVFCFLG